MRKRNKNTARAKAKVVTTLVSVGLLIAGLGGCSHVAYYGQSVIGHSKLMLARKPVSEALADARENNQVDLIQHLELAKQLRNFATQELGLPDNRSYKSFVALDRDYPVWNIVAAEEFSVEARQWCYLVIGCATYRGYFNRDSAEKYAASIRAKGFETVVGGVGAYSTLGWFADPILPSMFRDGEAVFAETVFHELAHQILYVNGNSDFNEAFATVVGEQGALKWLTQNRPELLQDYKRRLSAQRDFNQLLLNTRNQLAKVYMSEVGETVMRDRKRAVLDDLNKKYQALKIGRWGGQGWYDGWMSVRPNNARLASVATYFQGVPKFESVLVACGDDLPRFYQKVMKFIDLQQLEFEDVDCTAA